MNVKASSLLTDFLRVAAASVLILVAFQSFAVGYYTWMPMSWWIEYKSFEVLPPTPKGEQLVRVFRTVKVRSGIMPIRRYVELHEITEMGIIQYCQHDVATTAEFSPGLYALLYMEDFNPGCDWKRLEGRVITMQVSWLLNRPFNIQKIVSFETGPLRVEGGLLYAVTPHR